MTQKFVISQGKILQDRSLFAKYEAVTSILKANTKCWKVLSSQNRGSIENDKPANEWSICLLNKANFHIVLFPHLSYHIILILLLAPTVNTVVTLSADSTQLWEFSSELLHF